MQSKFKYPYIYRIGFILISLTAIIFSAFYYFKLASSPTDENEFNNTPSNLVCKQTNFVPAGDSIYGCLVLKVDSTRVWNKKFFDDALNRVNSDSLEITFLNTASNQTIIRKTAKKDLDKSALVEYKSLAMIIKVSSGGASDRAGLKVGDLICKINGVEFSNSLEADALMRAVPVGKAVVYDILRNGEQHKFNVILASFGIYVPLLITWLIGILSLILVGIFGFYRGEYKGIFYHLLVLLCIGCAFSFSAELIPSSILQNSTAALYTFFFLQSISNLAPIALTIGIFSYFPSDNEWMKSKKWIIRSYYIFALLVSVLILSKIIFQYSLPEIISLGINILAGIAITLLFVLNRIKNKNEKSHLSYQIRPLYVVAFIICVYMLGAAIFAKYLPKYLFQINNYLIALYPISFVYVVLKNHIFGCHIKVKRNIQYYIISWSIKAILILIFIKTLFLLSELNFNIPLVRYENAIIEIYDNAATEDIRQNSNRLIVILITLGVSFIFWELNKKIQEFIDKKYFKLRFDYKRAIEELSLLLSKTLSIEELSQNVPQKIAAFGSLKRVGLIVFKSEEEYFTSKPLGLDQARWDAFCGKIGPFAYELVSQATLSIIVERLHNSLYDIFKEISIKIVVPIKSKDRTLGAFFLGEKLSEDDYKRDDIDFYTAVAYNTAVALENVFLYEHLAKQERLKKEMEIARQIQLASLPQAPPTIAGLDVAGKSNPAFEVGGDFFDYLSDDADNITIIVGDVSGKGVSAALYMAKIQGIIRAIYPYANSLKEIICRANSALRSNIEKRSFVTALAVKFDMTAREVFVCRAGHLPLLHYSAKIKTISKISPKGFALAMTGEKLFNETLEEVGISFESGDVFIFISDGVIEARNSLLDEFGIERTLSTILSANASASAETIKQELLKNVKDFVKNEEQYDDMTIVVAKIK